MSKRNYTREEQKQRNNFTMAVVAWVLILLAVIVRVAL